MSPIKGMTNQLARFPQIGIIRKGAPKEPDRPGADLKCFRVVFEDGESNAALTFRDAYGDEPTDIHVMLPFDDIDRVWEAWREEYVASSLLHRCDGEYVQYQVHKETGECVVRDGRLISPIASMELKVGDRLPCTGQSDCKPTGRLQVFIPELRRAAILMVLTTSINDIVNISGQLQALKALNNDRLAGLPLILRRRPKRISTPRDANDPSKGRARREKWMLSLEADPEWMNEKIARLRGESFERLAAPSPYALLEDAVATSLAEQARDNALPFVPASRGRDNLFKEMRAPHQVVADERAETQADSDVVEGGVISSESQEYIEAGWEESDRFDFYDRVMDEIPYFEERTQVLVALEELDMVYNPAFEPVMLEHLETYASEHANAEAAAEQRRMM